MVLADRVEAIISLGASISAKISNRDEELFKVIGKAQAGNQWFTEKNILVALENWIIALKPLEVQKWTDSYPQLKNSIKSVKKVAVINAGNIPLVGLHDLLSIFVSGHEYIGKNATGDNVLLPYISSLLSDNTQALNNRIRFVDKLENMDAVIATGSNNSARYFEYYFGKYPHIIRNNRNGVGVLSGSESKEDLNNLGLDIFTYYGLGCRNVSKLYVPKGYNFSEFFKAIEVFSQNLSLNKYLNNFDYYNSILLLKRIPFLQNGFLIVREETLIPSPVSVVHFEEYDDKSKLNSRLVENFEQLQCVVCNENILTEDRLKKIRVDFGRHNRRHCGNMRMGLIR